MPNIALILDNELSDSGIDLSTIQSKITLTTLNNSGASTLITNTLNVPNYTLAGLGGEPIITAGTTAQYWRGDKSWQTLNTTAVVEGTNLYYTDARARAALSFVAGSGAYNSSTGAITIPTNTNQLTNGAGYTTNTGTVTSVAALTLGTTGTDLSSSVATGTTTAVITLNVPTASAANRGALSATDWSTFNGKQAALNGTGFVKASGTTISYDNTTYQSTAEKGAVNGYASLNSSGQVPSTQLPSYVDDVLEYANLAAFPATGEAGKIYVTVDTNKTYRWSGSAYVEISASPGSTDAVTEGTTNLYFTNTRARAAVSFTAGSGAYNSSTGVFTIPTNTNQLTNGAGFITGNQSITLSGDVSGSGTTTITTTLATVTQSSGANFVKITLDTKGRVTGNTAVGSGDITTALGYTPYNSTNPSGYTSNTGTVTSVGGTGTVSGLTLTGTVTTSGSLTLGGTLTLTAANVNAVGTITNSTSGDAGTVGGLAASAFVRAYTTTADNIDSDWGQSFKTFDPVPSGTPPISSPNLRTINVGENFNRRTQMAFDYAADRAWFRRKYDSSWSSWVEFYHTGNLTNLNQLSNGPGYITAAQTYYIGTTQNALNRASAAQTLTGVSIDGNAGTATFLKSAFPYNINITDSTTAASLSEPGSLTSVSMHASHGYFSGYATTLTMSGYDRYGVYQISGLYNAAVPDLVMRNYYQGTSDYTAWTRILSSANYNSYAPSLGGTGASGTWGINVTGHSNKLSVTSISNVNTERAAGYLEYYDVNGATGAPASGWHSYISVRHGNASNQYGFQFANGFGNDTLYFRGWDGTNPTAWRTVWTSGSLTNLNQLTNGPGYITGSYIPTSGGGYGNGNYEFASSDNTTTSYSSAAIELRETDRGSSGSYQAPRLAFHWGNVVASQISIESGGRIVIRDNPGTGYQAFAAATITAYGNIVASGDRPITLNITDGAIFIQGSSGGWATGTYFKGSAGTTHAGFGALGSADSFSNLWIGAAYNSTWMTFTSSAVNSQVALQQGGNQVLHAANYNSYAPTLTGTGASGTWAINVTGTAAYLPTYYVGNQQLNPQTYFAQSVGLRVAMTAAWSVWSDTLWINGYSGGDVLQMCALHTMRDGTPRIAISAQASNATSYGTMYQFLTEYNWTSYAPTKTGGGASGTWAINISGNAATATRTSSVSGYDHAGTGMYAFYNWGGSNGGAAPPDSGSYTVGISVGSNPGDQAYGFQIGRNMWNNGLWTRGYDSAWLAWVRLLDSANYNSYVPTLNGTGASGTWGISITGKSETVTINYNNDSNSTYQMLWGSGNSVYGTGSIYCNPFSDTIYAVSYRGSGNVGGTGEASNHPAGIYSQGTNWLYGTMYLNGNSINGASDIYNNQWFRNNNSNTGLYNQVTTMHLSSKDTGYWDVSSTTTVSSIRFFTGSHIGSLRGYVYATDGNEVGFLDQSGNWVLRCLTGNSYLTGTFTASGDVIAYSDARIKTNVETIENALEKVTSLRGVKYNRTDIEDKSEKIGVIAQEIQKVIPQVVNEGDDGILGVSYGNLAGVFIEAIKEQQAQIEDLKKQIQYLVENR